MRRVHSVFRQGCLSYDLLPTLARAAPPSDQAVFPNAAANVFRVDLINEVIHVGTL